MNTGIYGDFQICVSVPLMESVLCKGKVQFVGKAEIANIRPKNH